MLTNRQLVVPYILPYFAYVGIASVPADILEQLLAAVPEKNTATRNSAGEIMQRAADLVRMLDDAGLPVLDTMTQYYTNGSFEKKRELLGSWKKQGRRR